MRQPIDRRQFLIGSAAGLGSWWWNPLAAEPQRRPRVAAIFSEFRFRSHAFDFLENFIRPFLFRGKLVDPGVDVVSMYADQFPKEDMARDVSKRFNIPLCPTIEDAMTLGTGELAVDAVLSIVEHGQYPTNCRGVVMYPRKEFFDREVCVMQRANRFVPIFNDKHLSYSFEKASKMVAASRELRFPMLAGGNEFTAAINHNRAANVANVSRKEKGSFDHKLGHIKDRRQRRYMGFHLGRRQMSAPQQCQ